MGSRIGWHIVSSLQIPMHKKTSPFGYWDCCLFKNEKMGGTSQYSISKEQSHYQIPIKIPHMRNDGSGSNNATNVPSFVSLPDPKLRPPTFFFFFNVNF